VRRSAPHDSTPHQSSPATAPFVSRVITRLNIGGPARQALILTEALEQRGFRTDLVHGLVGSREGQLGSDVIASQLPTLKREIAPIADVRATASLYRRFRRLRPAIVHTHLAKAGATGRTAATLAGVPIRIHTYHGHVLDGYFSRPAERSFLLAERSLARFSDVLIAVSPIVRDEMLELGIGRPSQWRVIPLGLDLAPLLDLDTDRESARSRLGLSPTTVLVGMVSRLVPIKNIDLFLKAAVKIAQSRPEIEYVIAGDGESRFQLETRARQLDVPRIHFMGWIHDLRTLYSALDVVVLTSNNEGTPVSLIEAAAAARPAVATRVGGVPDVVQEGVTGFLVQPGSVEALSERILRLLADHELADRMGVAGRQWVGARFDSARLIDDVANLYEELLERQRVRPRSDS
jgi:glycosyltransferase involved in cell wall biosynthesis